MQRLVSNDNLRNDAGGDRCQDVFTAHANPLIAARRRIQVVSVVVVHHVVAAAIFVRHAASTLPFGMRLRIAAAVIVTAAAIRNRMPNGDVEATCRANIAAATTW